MLASGSIDRIHMMGAAFSVLILTAVFFMVRARMMKEKYALIWLFIGAFILVMSLFRELMDSFAGIIGVDYAPSAFFAILIACAYLLLLNASVSISHLKTQNKALAQELGLTRLRVEELEQKMDRMER